MPKKKATSDDRRTRGPCSLEAVKQYLMSDIMPEGYETKTQRRVLLRRAESFVLIGDELYFIGGRSKQYRRSTGCETAVAENAAESNNEDSSQSQTLRKVLFSEEEQREVINRAHVGDDGSHYGMEKTTEQVANQYYWLGITRDIWNAIHACPMCSSRIKKPDRFRNSNAAGPDTSSSSVTPSSANVMATVSPAEVADAWDAETEDENVNEDGENDEDDARKPGGGPKLQVVKQEMTDVADDIMGIKQVGSKQKNHKRRRTRVKKRVTKPIKKVFPDGREWGARSSLEIVKQFLLYDTVPEGYNKNEKRVLVRRAKSFMMIEDEMYFTGGRVKQKPGRSNDGMSGEENSETESEQTQDLRKVVFSEEERLEILNRAHLAEDGSHQGTERTKEEVSNKYYWMGITYGVRDTIQNCTKCSFRSSKSPGQSKTVLSATTPKGAANKKSVARKTIVADKREEDVNNGPDGNDVNESKAPSDAGLTHVVKEELWAEDSASKRESPQSAATNDKAVSREQKTSTPSEEKERGACSSLEVVRQYLLTNAVPSGYNRNDRRALLRRAKSFVMIRDDMYFTGGRSRQCKSWNMDRGAEGAEDPEDEPDHTQVLRKVVFSREEQQEVLNRAHIGEDGSHHGVEKTTERVSNYCYWLGITYGIRNTISNCVSCSSRSKNLFRSMPFPDGPIDTIPTLNSSQGSGAAAINTSGVKKSEAVGSWEDEEMDVDHGNDVGVDDDDDDDDDEDGGYVIDEDTVETEAGGTATEAQPVKQESNFAWPMDVFSFTREVCSHFWQKVEIQIFGPYQAGTKQIYVAVALDSYSQFPEAVTMEVLSSATLTNFLLNLFCRYGVMEKIVLLQNEITRNKDLYVNMKDLQQADISPSLQCLLFNPLDERWNHLEKSLARFVSLYPDFWFHCLEVFMVPLRITLPPEAIYSPYYLVHGREPPVPDKLNQVCEVNPSAHTEVQLTEEQEKQTVEMIALAYGIYSDNPSIPATLPEPSVTTASSCTQTDDTVIVQVEKPKQEQQQEESEPGDVNGASGFSEWGRGGLGGKKEVVDVEQVAEEEEQSDMEIDGPFDIPSGAGTDPEDDSDRDATYRPNIKGADKTKRSPVIGKRKRGRPRKVVPSNIAAVPNPAKINIESKKVMIGLQSSLIKNMRQLPLDTFYFIVRQYLEHNAFPPGLPTDTKQSISRLSQMFSIRDGKLYSGVGKSAGRLIVTGEKARISLLRKAHARAEVHHGRVSVLKYLSELNVFWNGMSLDLDAFIHCCPECIAHNPLGNLSVVHIPSKSASLTAEGRKEDEPHVSEDEEEEISYEDVIQYLTDHTFPPSTTPHQQQHIQECSQSFRIIQGSLHYQTQRMTEPLQVLISDSTKFSAIQEAHVGVESLRKQKSYSDTEQENVEENGDHLSQQDTQARLRGQYFWSGMTFDVLKHVMACCMKHSLCSPPVLHRNPLIQDRVDKFRTYYTEGKNPKLDPRAVTATEVQGNDSNTSLTKKNQPSSVGDAKSFILDHAVIKTVKNIIEGIDKQVSVKNKKAETRESGEKDPTEPSTAGSTRNPKANKCQFCGEYIGGNVAYKIHLYKHTGVKQFICSTCGKAFTTNRSLLIHTRKHTGIKPYLCNQCGRGFFRSASLHYHLRAHAVGRGTPVSCDVCHRTFSTDHRLARHKEFKHPAEAKVFICNQCGKNFTAARSLKRHEQIHSGHKKYQCQHCSKSFFRKEYLNAHLVNHSEHESVDTQKPRPREKSKIPQSRSDSHGVYWERGEQSAPHLEDVSATEQDRFQGQAVAAPPSFSSSSHVSHHLPVNSVVAHSHMAPPHALLHPMAHTARLMNVAGPHGPLSLTVSSARSAAEAAHVGSGQGSLLQHDAVPGQFGGEGLSGEGTNLSDADLSTIHMLAQAGIPGSNLHSM